MSAMPRREWLVGMGEALDDHASRSFLAAIQLGDVCSGTVMEATRSHGLVVTLDGFRARPLGVVGSLDLSWRQHPAMKMGQRIYR
ncbi:hypothetical protein ABZ783_24805 [Micromonospora sp. NPDC047738]|uniref:hypothetical protein n=1 Tax=Micromonospora sp. NPDC047738 TaxID=3155741 RepID=UPI0033C06545